MAECFSDGHVHLRCITQIWHSRIQLEHLDNLAICKKKHTKWITSINQPRWQNAPLRRKFIVFNKTSHRVVLHLFSLLRPYDDSSVFWVNYQVFFGSDINLRSDIRTRGLNETFLRYSIQLHRKLWSRIRRISFNVSAIKSSTFQFVLDLRVK